MGDMRTVTVNVGHTSYPVFVGTGARRELAAVVPASVRRVAVVTQDSVPAGLIPSFAGLDVSLHLIGEGEDHKSMATVETLCRAFSRAGLTRNDLVVGVGGGMVTDVAGFAAASYHRGTRVMHVATTLLGMVDAAIGGKTGVNIPEGKNLIGAFWQPSAVACDLDALGTLPEREHRCGSGELAKYHFIAREDLASLDLSGRIARAVEIKARIVEADEREGGERALLNYGHTLGHAVESLTAYSIAHGEAVALGLLFAAHLAVRMGRIGEERLAQHYEVVRGTYGLDVRMPPSIPFGELVEEMGRDKKALSSLTFVLDSPAGLQVVPDVPVGVLEAAYGDFLAENS
ncbi:MAG: 3-dehydroquinate synthase [Actinobacteria bacterium]|nr:3-dehydroquinate synthase [Actinomycetota bacterium]